jgi:hypothetical protein
MLYRIAYQTPVGWFFWTDENYSKAEKAEGLIAAMPKGGRENCFVVCPDRHGNWERAW